MKLTLLSNDIDLQQSLDNTGYFKEVSTVESLNDQYNSDVLVISDLIVDHNELSLFYGEQTKEKKKNQITFYMMSNYFNEQINQNIISICESKNIIVIPPKLTLQQIVDRIIKVLFPEIGGKNQNIAVFFGADSKVGTTMIAQMVAEMLARNTDLKVALLFLNDRPSTAFLKSKEDENIGLDEIKIKLFNKILTSDELLSTCVRHKELFVLQGPRYVLDVRHYHPEHVENLIQLARKEFDVIIIDAGSDIRLGMAVGALRSTNIRYLVTTQQEEAKNTFELTESQVLKALQMSSSDFLLVVNKYLKSESIYTGKQLADLYKMSLATTLPNMEYGGWQAEFDKKSLIHYENEEMNFGVDQLCKLIAAQMKFEYRSNSTKKEGWISKISDRLAGGRSNSWF